MESTSVPGRNGDIITENARTGRRRYQNVDIKYKAFFFNGLPAKTAAVKAWLLSPIGYQKLQDTYDPDFFRMAVCKDALEFDVTAQKAAAMELTFNCKPQRWSVDGQRVIRLDGRSTLKNPFAFPAQPIFKVYGDSGGELYVGEEKITIHSIKAVSYTHLDVYKRQLLNRPLKTSAFMPEIKGGSKVMAFGDYSYYWVADRQNRTFRRLNELYARTDQVGFLTTQRVDGKLILPEAVQLLQMAPQG